MTDKFRKLDDDFYASPQIGPADVVDAKEMGIACIVNNRPDGEDPLAPQGAMIEAAARAMHIDYVAIPITRAGFSSEQIAIFSDIIGQSAGPVLGYCRAGTRSTMLWALARASAGCPVDEVKERAAHAGYDLTAIEPLLDILPGSNR